MPPITKGDIHPYKPSWFKPAEKGQTMSYHMYSIRDSKAECFNIPFSKPTHGIAEREFQTMVNDERSPIYQYPEDYDLYHVGSYDERTGKITPLDSPVHMQKAIHLKQEKN